MGSGAAAVSEAITCPFCGSEDLEVISAWAGQIITTQVKCHRCKAYFEALRDDFVRLPDPDPPPTWTTS
jgi:transcription elongation factor Elf1